MVSRSARSRGAMVGSALGAAGSSGARRRRLDAAWPRPTDDREADAQHAGITTPHGDHSPHHGGMVLMNGEMHYEVVFDRGGQAPRLVQRRGARRSAGVDRLERRDGGDAKNGAHAETLALKIDDSGESWVADGQPLAGGDVMVKLTYSLRGEPFEIEIPFLIVEAGCRPAFSCPCRV